MFPWFYRVSQAQCEAKNSRGSWVIRQTFKSKHILQEDKTSVERKPLGINAMPLNNLRKKPTGNGCLSSLKVQSLFVNILIRRDIILAERIELCASSGLLLEEQITG